ncbi:RING finger protein 37 [Pelobates fuscus]|uniref:RING finger protein 37 n=1 Tax=Pelobates fuscus TaxID=191477 RepID=UPI002FE4DEC2
MVINVCLPQFKPRIVCSKISADGYEVDNLISEDLAKRNRGFRCEYFIKPPLHIIIYFPFNVDICRINIDTSSGGHHNFSGMDIYTSASAMGDQLQNKDDFLMVGKVLLKNQSKVTFNNRGFKPRRPFHQTDYVMSYHGSSCQDLWSKGPYSLSSIAQLKICITHVGGGALCALKRVEVWGQPSKTCPKEVVEGVYQVACLSLPNGFGQQNPSSPMESNHISYINSENAQHGLGDLANILRDVPEEFLDPITLEIMTLPMLLPSGKVIDQSTLDKCNQSEASWGRMPSDPFTGVPYSQQSQPVYHPTLKVRIDYFLLQHSIPGSNILGRKQSGAVVAPSSVALSSMKRKVEFMEDCDNNEDNVQTYFSAVSGLNAYTSDFNTKKMKTDNECHSSQMDCSASIPDSLSHEQKLAQSLDLALSATLGSMPSYTARFTKGQQEGIPVESAVNMPWNSSSVIPEQNRSALIQGCASCLRTFSLYCKTEPIYQLSCGHLMCRPCLSEKQKSHTIVCMNCNRSVATRDVLRVHL